MLLVLLRFQRMNKIVPSIPAMKMPPARRAPPINIWPAANAPIPAESIISPRKSIPIYTICFALLIELLDTILHITKIINSDT